MYVIHLTIDCKYSKNFYENYTTSTMAAGEYNYARLLISIAMHVSSVIILTYVVKKYTFVVRTLNGENH